MTKNTTLQLEPTQKLLLQACLLRGEAAVAAWQNWLKRVNIETLEPSSSALLSLLYRNLSRQQLQDTELSRLKGVFRRYWTYNQVLLKVTKPLLEELSTSGVEVIVFGDLVWFTSGYADENQRPSRGLAWFVSDFQTSETILRRQMWEKVTQTERLQIWEQGGKVRLTLHRHLFIAMPQDYTDQQMWQYSVVTEIAGVKVRRLSVTDQVLVTSMQIMTRGKVAQKRFLIGLVDLFKLLQTSDGAVDWVRLVQQGQRYEGILPLRTVLAYLQENFALSIPDWVLPSLWKMPISHYELLTYDLRRENWLLQGKGLLLRQIHAYQSLIKA